MALIKCPECGQDVSSEANTCIHCGYPLKKNINQPEEQPKPTGTQIIGYRGGPGGVLTLYIIGFIIGLLVLIGAILLICFFKESYVVVFAFIEGAFGLTLVVITTIEFIGIGINASNKNHCIVYDADNRKLILATMTGKIVIINPEDYVELKDSFATSNILKFTYRLPDGSTKRLSLGYCSNRGELRKKLDGIIKR